LYRNQATMPHTAIVNDVTNCNTRPVSEKIVIFRTIAL
jgi:hypothetical protein